jgi:hypothetical protein
MGLSPAPSAGQATRVDSSFYVLGNCATWEASWWIDRLSVPKPGGAFTPSSTFGPAIPTRSDPSGIFGGSPRPSATIVAGKKPRRSATSQAVRRRSLMPCPPARSTRLAVAGRERTPLPSRLLRCGAVRLPTLSGTLPTAVGAKGGPKGGLIRPPVSDSFRSVRVSAVAKEGHQQTAKTEAVGVTSRGSVTHCLPPRPRVA